MVNCPPVIACIGNIICLAIGIYNYILYNSSLAVGIYRPNALCLHCKWIFPGIKIIGTSLKSHDKIVVLRNLNAQVQSVKDWVKKTTCGGRRLDNSLSECSGVKDRTISRRWTLFGGGTVFWEVQPSPSQYSAGRVSVAVILGNLDVIDKSTQSTVSRRADNDQVNESRWRVPKKSSSYRETIAC